MRVYVFPIFTSVVVCIHKKDATVLLEQFIQRWMWVNNNANLCMSAMGFKSSTFTKKMY